MSARESWSRRVVVWLFVAAIAVPASAAGFSFEERVEAQRAIEAVYWDHRIWPEQSRDPKPSLSEVLDEPTLRARLARRFDTSPEHLPTDRPSPLLETTGAFVVTLVLDASDDAFTTATVTWSDRPFEDWWAARTRRSASNSRGNPRSTGRCPWSKARVPTAAAPVRRFRRVRSRESFCRDRVATQR